MEKILAAVPPMGWNSWNTFGEEFDAEVIMQMADVLADKGYLDCVYEYLILDDCWAELSRDESGRMVPSKKKFPDGLAPVIDYVHGKGLKFGIYSCCGVKTCAGYPASFEHEAVDAAAFAEWGVDYLKYDNCYRPVSQGSELLYRRMGNALRSSGRDIIFAACQWGTENVGEWIRSTGAHTYRSSVDIRDNWESIRSIAEVRFDHLGEGGAGCHNDMDMLVCGMYGCSSNPEVHNEGCTQAEYRTHFALWAMLNSPLIIGCDLRTADEFTRELLQNRDLISINQDPEVRTCYKLDCESSPGTFALVRTLSGGRYAVGLFNFSENELRAPVSFWDMGISSAAGQKMSFYDCFMHGDAGVFEDSFCVRLGAHDCSVYIAKPE